MKINIDNALIERFERKFVEAFDEIEIAEEAEQSTDLESIAEKYLGQDINNECFAVDIEEEISSTSRRRRVRLFAKGRWLFITAVIIAMTFVALILGNDTAVSFLKAIR